MKVADDRPWPACEACTWPEDDDGCVPTISPELKARIFEVLDRVMEDTIARRNAGEFRGLGPVRKKARR